MNLSNIELNTIKFCMMEMVLCTFILSSLSLMDNPLSLILHYESANIGNGLFNDLLILIDCSRMLTTADVKILKLLV